MRYSSSDIIDVAGLRNKIGTDCGNADVFLKI
jgi:hypothetical protein